MDNSKSAKICAYLSLAISVVLMVLWSCNVGGFETVNLDTFVGVIVALLAIIVTLAVAWQIYNAVEMKNKVEELKQLEDRLKVQEKSLEQMEYSNRSGFNRLASLSASVGMQFTHAVRFNLYSLEAELQLKEPKNVDSLLAMMELIVGQITPNTKFSADMYEEVVKTNKQIRSSRNYDLIKSRYEHIYKEFMSKVEKEDDKEQQ